MKEPLDPPRCARLLKSLADADRLRIIGLLRQGSMNVGEMAGALQLPAVNVSHHLSVLKQAGLVQDQRQGRFIVYALTPGVFQPADSASEPEYLDLGCCRLEMPR